MTTKIYEVIKEIKDMEANLDSESNCHYYTVEYQSNSRIIISIVEEYYYYDECNEYCCEDQKEAFAHVDADFEVAMNTFFDILSGAALYHSSNDKDFKLCSLVYVKRL